VKIVKSSAFKAIAKSSFFSWNAGVLPALFTLFAAVCLLAVGHAAKAAEENIIPNQEKTDFSRFTGETLVYSIKWDPPWYMFFLPSMEAGEMTFKFQGIDQFRGKPAVKIVITARSSGTLAKLANMEVRDEFLFYSNPETLCAEGSVSTIREGKRMRRLEVEYVQDERRGNFRAFDESVTPPELQRDVALTDLPPCVQDPFTALYFYSTLPLEKGYAKNLVIGNDDKVLDVRTRIEKQDTIDTPAGKFKAWKINTNALRGGLFREDGDFYVWVSADERKALVRFEAKVRLGRVFGILKSMETAGVRR